MNSTPATIERIEMAMNAMRRAVAGARERFGEGMQLSKTQIEILMMLVSGPKTTGELARELFVTGSAVTQTIDTLVRRKLVERRSDDSDRRIVRLDLSSAGRELTAHLAQLRRRYLQELVERLTTDELNALITATEKLTEIFKDTQSRLEKSPV
jgi:DNA-binding MarR family transcriptional regulator